MIRGGSGSNDDAGGGRTEYDRLLGGGGGGFGGADTQHAADNRAYGTASNHSASPLPQLPSSMQLFNYAANVAVHALLLGITAFVTYISFYKGIVLFTWHPPLMLLGFFILMTEAICCFIEPNIPTLGLSAPRRKQIHWILQAIAGCSITIAFVVILLNKNRLQKAHFTSWHGIFGLVAVISTGISLAGGVLALYSVQWRQTLRLRPAAVKLMHSVAGVLAYGFGIVAISLGVLSPWFGEHADQPVQIGCVVVVVVVAVYAVLAPIWRSWGRLKQVVGA